MIDAQSAVDHAAQPHNEELSSALFPTTFIMILFYCAHTRQRRDRRTWLCDVSARATRVPALGPMAALDSAAESDTHTDSPLALRAARCALTLTLTLTARCADRCAGRCAGRWCPQVSCIYCIVSGRQCVLCL
jgi:hypothetical protein